MILLRPPIVNSPKGNPSALRTVIASTTPNNAAPRIESIFTVIISFNLTYTILVPELLKPLYFKIYFFNRKVKRGILKLCYIL